MGPHHRHVAGMIMRAVVLLVGLLMLFIDDNEAEIGVGQKQRRTRPHHHRRFARGDRGPVARTGTRGQFGMPFQRPHAEAVGETVEELSGQRDLRHQDQRLPAAADDLGNGFEIDLGLARAGDAVEQRDVETAVGGERPHGVHRAALLTGEIRLGVGRIRYRRRQRRRHRLDRQRAFIDKPIDHPGTDAGFPGGLGFAVQQAIGQDADQPPPRRRQSPGRLADQPHAHPHPLRAEMLAHPQRHPQHHAARGQRVVGDPVDQRAQFLSQRRHVKLFADILEAIVQARIGIGVFGPNHRHHLARAERHANDVAGLEFHAARHPVGIGMVERDRHQHIDDARR